MAMISTTTSTPAIVRRTRAWRVATLALVAGVSATIAVDATAKPQRHCVTTIEAHDRTRNGTRETPPDASTPSPRPCPSLLAHDDDATADASNPRIDDPRAATVAHG